MKHYEIGVNLSVTIMTLFLAITIISSVWICNDVTKHAMDNGYIEANSTGNSGVI